MAISMSYFQRIFDKTIPDNADKLFAKTERAMRKALRGSFDNVNAQIEELFLRFGLPDGTLPANKVYAYNRLTNLENAIADELKKLGSKVNRMTRDTIKTTFTESTQKSFEAFGDLGIGLKIHKIPMKTLEANIFNPYDRIKWTERNKENIARHIREIKGKINEGIIQGKHYSVVARDIREVGEKTFNDIRRIVRTEQHRAQTSAINYACERADEDAKDLGIRVGKKWIHEAVGNYREEHKAMDGQIADEEGFFTAPDGARAEYPSGFGVPEHDINCRCSIGTVLLDDKERKELDPNELDNLRNGAT